MGGFAGGEDDEVDGSEVVDFLDVFDVEPIAVAEEEK